MSELSRRGVLGVGVAAVGLAAVAALPAAEAWPEIWVLSDSRFPVSGQFAAAMPATRRVVVGPAMTELFDVAAAALPEFVVGLTSDPVAMVAGQLLREAGGRPCLHRIHRHCRDGWTHQAVATGPSGAGGALWLDHLARVAQGRLEDGHPADHHSPALLATWAFSTRGNG